MKYVKCLILSLSLSIYASAFATAGFAEHFYDHQHWIFPAYAYCLGFGLATLFIMITVSLLFKAKTRSVIRLASTFLKEHHIWGIIVAGTLWAIILGIIGDLLWELIWFLALVPLLVIMVCFPLGLSNRKIRENWLLSPIMLKYTGMVVISAIIASVLFIILTNLGVLEGTDITYLAYPDMYRREFYTPTHPYDSMEDIWEMPLLFLAEIIIALFLFYLGMIMRRVLKKLHDSLFIHS